MGNCLKGSTADDVSLLPAENSNEADRRGNVRQRREYPIIYPTPSETRQTNRLSEEEEVKIARRIGLLEHIPILKYDDSSHNNIECVICMIDLKADDQVRYLPCLHIYHVVCIDDWLMRSFTCPSCLEPVDAALLTSYYTI